MPTKAAIDNAIHAAMSTDFGESRPCWMSCEPPEKGVTFLFAQSLPDVWPEVN